MQGVSFKAIGLSDALGAANQFDESVDVLQVPGSRYMI
jgi:hypothetical protein